MSSTITNISSLINTGFPVPGADNDTQGFRDNFGYTQRGLAIAATEINDIQIVQSGIINQLNTFVSPTEVNATVVTATNINSTNITNGGIINTQSISATGDISTNGYLRGSARYLTEIPRTDITSVGTLTTLSISNTETTATFSVSRGNLVINGVDSIVFYSTATTSTSYLSNEGPGSFDSTLTVGSVVGINVGDSFKLFSTDTVHTVKGINTVSNKITTEPFNPTLAIANGLTAGTIITFTKGKVAGSASYTGTAPATSKGAIGDKKGMLFATTANIYVCFADYSNGVSDIWARTTTTGATW
jgi:hypothetical protein